MSASNAKKVSPVRVTIVSAAGKCPQSFKVGDSWLINEGKTPNGMCAAAYHNLFGYIRVFRFGGEHPWDIAPGVIKIACPDATNRLVYEIKRVDGD